MTTPSTSRRLRDRVAAVARHALPQACTLCAAASGTELVCKACARAMPRNGPACPRCALPFAPAPVPAFPPGSAGFHDRGAHAGRTARAARCRACAFLAPAFDASVAVFAYAWPLDRLVHSLKYEGALPLAGWFADRMLESGEPAESRATGESRPEVARPDVIVAMPLAAARQRERGFNHALEIARGLARGTGIPLAARSVIRTRDTPAQATLPWAQRAVNVMDAFATTTRFDGRSVLVVDDVMTTGASLDELARTLKAAGAARVENWVVARTPPPRTAPAPSARPMAVPTPAPA